jgi:membrane-bound acyltransferase YfiQ involved in biofilm formation
LLGLGRRSLTATGPLLRYAREASYPIYILHQTVIVLIAFVVVGWQADVTVKYLALLLLAAAGTLLLYELLIRRYNSLRFLFGMKLLARPGSTRSAASVARRKAHVSRTM